MLKMAMSRWSWPWRVLTLTALTGLVVTGMWAHSSSRASAADMTAISVDHGDQDTSFNLILPSGAACSQDTATGHYQLFSYLVDTAKVPASSIPTLNFSSGAPNQGLTLFDTGGTGYEQKATFPVNGGVPTPPTFSWSQYNGDFGPSMDLYPGTFNAGIACATDKGVVDGDNFWNIQITFAAHPTSQAPDGFTWTLAPFVTTTALTASPAGSAVPGAAVTLTATVSPATAPGTVTFSSDGKAIGSGPVPVIFHVGSPASASATLVTGALAAGAHSLTAAYTPTVFNGPGITGTDVYAASQSAAVPYSISAPSSSTTTTLASTATTAPSTTGTTLNLTGTTIAGGASGTGGNGGGSTGAGATGAGATGTAASGSGSAGASSGSGGGGASPSSDPTLAHTGASVTHEVVIGVMAVFAGLFLLSFAVPARRRQDET